MVATALSLGGCGRFSVSESALSDRECMARVMYFESNRSSEDGMLAVGTVVMNRVQDHRYPKTICGVIGQRSQFAEGALTKPVSGAAWTRALRVADAVGAGQRHDTVGSSRFFHTAGMTFPYRNMAYVVIAGGNAFYDKKPAGTFERLIPTATTLVAENEVRSRAERMRLAAAGQEALRREGKLVRVASTSEDDGDAPRARAARAEPSRSREAAAFQRRPTPPATLASATEDEEPPRARTPRAERPRFAEADEDDTPRRRAPVRLASTVDTEDLDLPSTRARTRPPEQARSSAAYDDEPAPPSRASRATATPPRPERALPTAPSRSTAEPPPPRREARPAQRMEEPLVLASAARRDRGPPTIGELIELDLERPRKR